MLAMCQENTLYWLKSIINKHATHAHTKTVRSTALLQLHNVLDFFFKHAGNTVCPQSKRQSSPRGIQQMPNLSPSPVTDIIKCHAALRTHCLLLVKTDPQSA